MSRQEDGMRLLADEEMVRWMNRVPWIWAKTYAKTHPHEYCLKRAQDPRRFEEAVATIFCRGYDRWYLRRPWRTLSVGSRHFVWFHTLPEEAEEMGLGKLLEKTILINRWRSDAPPPRVARTPVGPAPR